MNSQKEIDPITSCERWFVIANDNKIWHRLDGPAFIYKNGDYVWYKMGVAHRDYGPAIFVAGNESWVNNGVYHRLDGPAYYPPNMQPQWWFNGKYIVCKSQKEFEQLLKLKAFW